MTDVLEIENTEDGLMAHVHQCDIPADELSSMINEVNHVIKEYRKNSKRNDQALNHGKLNKHAALLRDLRHKSLREHTKHNHKPEHLSVLCN